MAMNRAFKDTAELPQLLPLFPLPCALVLPRAELPLNIFEPRYIAMVDYAMRHERMIGMIQPIEEDGDGTLFPIGCAGRITAFIETGDGRYQLTLTGIARFNLGVDLERGTPFRMAAVDYRAFETDLVHREDEDAGVDREALFDALKGYAARHSLSVDWDSVRKAPSEALVNALSMMSPFGIGEKQALLEAATVSVRADVLVAITRFELAGDDDGPSRMQ